MATDGHSSDTDAPDGFGPHALRVWEAYRSGEWCEDVPEVDASVLRRVLLAPPPPVAGHLARLRLRGARVIGTLDLTEADIACSVRLHRCVLDEAPRLDGAHLGALELRDCDLPGLTATGAGFDRECALLDCRINGTVNLRSSSVGAGLALDRCVITVPADSAALDAESLCVDEDFTANDITCTGKVFLNSSQVGNTVGFRGARLRGGTGVVLQAPELKVTGGLYLDRGFVCEGPINLYNASIGGSVHLEDATLTGTGQNRGEPALQLLCASVGGDIQAGRGLTVHGCLELRDTSVRGTVTLKRARLDNPRGDALKADRLHVGGNLNFRGGFVSRGTIDLCDARIGGSVLFEGADLTAPAGDDTTDTALRAHGAEVGAEFNCCQGFTAHGRVAVSGVTARARLCFRDARIDSPAGQRALDCRRSTAAELVLSFREAPDGIVDLSHSRVGVLRDDPATWPRTLVLDGFGYDGLQPVLHARNRLPWLDRDPGGFVTQPYEQLGAHYRRHGRDADARTVLLARQRRLSRTLFLPARAWSLLQDVTVGYGYRPQRALWLLAALFTAGTALFAAHPPAPSGNGTPPGFQPAIYTLDVLIPVVDFGQQTAYVPHGALRWAVVALVTAGWLLATTVATGLNRVLQRT
ncbi:hypothetical protein ABZX39_25515 [Streptomyces collinus]|uniref:hypothetical protein n=1 Tax=Streptomyces collinus TaxID=42684 RepID=UPI0033B6603C